MKRALGFAVSCLLAACGGSATVSSDAADGGAPPPAPDGGVSPASCSAPLPVAVASRDLYGYPPYATEGCALAYVSPDGDLVLVDAASGARDTVAPASERPRRPVLTDVLVAWEATVAGADVVRVRGRGASGARTVAVAAATREPRAFHDVVVVTAWRTTDELGATDVYLYDATADATRPITTGPAQKRFADVSKDLIAYTDFSEDPDGRFDDDGKDLADVVVVDRASGVVTRRAAPGKQAFPMLASGAPGRVAYMSWGEVHPEPKLQAYELRAGRVDQPASSDLAIAQVSASVAAPIRPSLSPDGTLEWIATTGSPALMRAPIDGSRAPRATTVGEGSFDLFAPASSAAFTLVAGRRPRDATPVLYTLAR